MRFYFASTIGNISKIRPNSKLSTNASIVHKFMSKKNKKTYLYKGNIENLSINKDKDYPIIFTNIKELNVSKVVGIEYSQLIDSSKNHLYLH